MVERLAALKPRRLAIVACDPATLARDLAALTASGYRIAGMTLVDLFPQTFHLETGGAAGDRVGAIQANCRTRTIYHGLFIINEFMCYSLFILAILIGCSL